MWVNHVTPPQHFQIIICCVDYQFAVLYLVYKVAVSLN